MSGYEIAILVLGLVTLLAGISWATIIKTWKSTVKNAYELRDEYNRAIADGDVDDTERARIGQKAIELIDNALDLWQQAVNIFYRIKRLRK